MLRDADDKVKLRVYCLHDGVCSKACGYVDDGCRSTRCGDGIHNGVKDGHAVDGLSRLTGGHAADDVRAEVEHLLRVKHGGLSGDALHDGFGVFINQN